MRVADRQLHTGGEIDKLVFAQLALIVDLVPDATVDPSGVIVAVNVYRTSGG